MGENQGQAPYSGEPRDILADSARRFDIPAHESIMSAMRIGILLCLLLAAAGLTGCGSIETLTPSNLKVEVRSFENTHAPTDSFKGTFKFVNKTLKNIRAEFPTSQWYDLAFYDSLGVERFHLNQGSQQRITYLELGPLGTHTEQLRFTFYQLSPGTYRVRAWVAWHEDVYSETAIEVK